MPARPIKAPSGVSEMDRLHHELFNSLEKLSLSKDHEFVNRYRAFVSQIELAFRQEERWMENINFPEFQMHQEQHARVLGALHNVHFHLMDGELQLGRKIAEQLLPQWLSLHISTMDNTLALAMQHAQCEHISEY